MKMRIPWTMIMLSATAVADLCPGSAGGPTVSTPGSVGCTSEATATGTRTIYSIMEDSVFDWGRLNLAAGDELRFDFVGGSSVANRLGAGSNHVIDGSVTGDGRVGFFAEGVFFNVNGSVTADEVVLASGQLVDPASFLAGDAYQVRANNTFQQVTIDGVVEATRGDVVVAGNRVRIRGEAQLRAEKAVRIGAGETVDVGVAGESRVSASGGSGVLLHLGDSRASSLELVASSSISNAGRLEADGGFGKVFLEVGPGGSVLNEGTGLILGHPMVTGNFDSDGVILGFDEGDGLGVVNASVVNIPALKDPSGRELSKAREIETNSSMTGTADALRKPVKKSSKVARSEKKPLLRRQSFFGMRGGSSRKSR